MNEFLASWYPIIVASVLVLVLSIYLFSSLTKNKRISKKVITKCSKIWTTRETEEVLKSWSFVEL